MEITRVVEKDEENGLDVDLILDEFKLYSEEFICLICSNLVLNPITCNKCHNFFCKKCIVQWLQTSLTCPNRCKFVEEPFNRKLSILLNKIKLKCGYTKKGCNKIVSYESYMTHYKSCEYGIYKCGNTKCKFVDSKENVELHIKICPFSIKMCKYCNSKMENKLFETHDETCGKKLMNCSLCDMEMMERELEAHYHVCEKYGIECKVCMKSISKEEFHSREKCMENVKKELKKTFEKEKESLIEEIKAIKKKEQNMMINYNDLLCVNSEYTKREKNTMMEMKKLKISLANLQADYKKIQKENTQLKSTIEELKRKQIIEKNNANDNNNNFKNTVVIEKNLLFEENTNFDNNFPIIMNNITNNFDEMLNNRINIPLESKSNYKFSFPIKNFDIKINTNPVIKRNLSKEKKPNKLFE